MRYREPGKLDVKQTIAAVAGFLFLNAVVLAIALTVKMVYVSAVFFVLSLFQLVAWHSYHFGYRCGNCGNEFSIGVLKDFISPQGAGKRGGWKLLRCPRCGKITKAHVLAIERSANGETG